MSKNFSDFLDYVKENNISIETKSISIDLNNPETLQSLVDTAIFHNTEATIRLLEAYHNWLNAD